MPHPLGNNPTIKENSPVSCLENRAVWSWLLQNFCDAVVVVTPLSL
ncbi:MAG: hypothetical protein O3B13_20665 [Planctomycetota bacterium]|nr:hypothetical protein [Planctomycetota bacterium]